MDMAVNEILSVHEETHLEELWRKLSVKTQKRKTRCVPPSLSVRQRRSSSLAVRRRTRQVKMIRWQHTTLGRRRVCVCGGGGGRRGEGRRERW